MSRVAKKKALERTNVVPSLSRWAPHSVATRGEHALPTPLTHAPQESDDRADDVEPRLCVDGLSRSQRRSSIRRLGIAPSTSASPPQDS